MESKDNFLIGRLKSVKYAAKGAWLLITTEHSIIVQVVIGIIMTILGFIIDLTITDLLFQITVIFIVFLAIRWSE